MSRSDERPIDIEYNEELCDLAATLRGVDRPGSFASSGAAEAHIPNLSVEGVGRISFPVPPFQAKQLVEKAERAPYGRGEETLVDTDVRNVWQIRPDDLLLGGKRWSETLDDIVADVARGLGAGHLDVSAEIYKLLVYDEGSFFVSHRDTEKTAGMFGTLVVVLPSVHDGGDLVVRHAGNDTRIDLSVREAGEHGASEDMASTLRYAAFYADCEHEVLPVTSGYRICLVYNLLHARRGKRSTKCLEAPDYGDEIGKAAASLEAWRDDPGRAAKIAYLLEHQYTPKGLAFSGLKNGDAAIANVLVQASARSDCVVHLGIVHIEESGSAEVFVGGYGGYGGYRRSRWGYREPVEIADPDEDDYELIEIHDWRRFIDSWVDPHDKPVRFGELPLGVGELLPAGALDGEPPDELRVREATGNEGGSLERAYHRAAIVIWPAAGFAKVVLQGGVTSCVPYFAMLVREAGTRAEREQARDFAGMLLGKWESEYKDGVGRYAYSLPRWGFSEDRRAAREGMLEALCSFGDEKLLLRFLESVIAKEFDGTEVADLVTAFDLLASRSDAGMKRAGGAFVKIVEAKIGTNCRECIRLLAELVGVRKKGNDSTKACTTVKRRVATAVVAGLAQAASAADDELDEEEDDWRWSREDEPEVVPSGEVVDLVRAVLELGSAALTTKTVEAIATSPTKFPPDTTLVPALDELRKKDRIHARGEAAVLRLWTYTTEFLLGRSEFPPEEPVDWAQEVELSCRCELCRELASFARHATEPVHRFSVRKELRRHLHDAIDRAGLDMDHVTERRGSPYTLVCTKNRHSFRARLEQHRADIRCLKRLVDLGDGVDRGSAGRVRRRASEAFERGR